MATACGPPASSLDGLRYVDLAVGDSELTALVADMSQTRRQGLRGVPELPGDADGMLFVWDEPTTATFGMRDTLIPLDVWWFDVDGHLLGGAQMEPCRGSCPSYASPGPVRWALETPAGVWDFGPGDRLDFP